MDRINLDHSATTPVLPAIAAALAEAYAAPWGNPASQHHAGRQARRVVEEARERIADLLSARADGRRPDHVLFTSGATEANNLALFGMVQQPATRVIVSAVEHPSVLEPAERLQTAGHEVQQSPVDESGVIQVEPFDERLAAGPALASVMLVNHETGVIQPIERLAERCASRGALLHVDAAQAVGKIPVDFRTLGVAALSISGHKFHAPPGIGALIVRADVPLRPQLLGGVQQFGLRAGSEPVALIYALRVALEAAHRSLAENLRQMTVLRDRFEADLRRAVSNIVVQGAGASRSPYVSNVAFPGIDRQQMLLALDTAGVLCSTGSACSSGSSETSPVLRAMGRPAAVLGSALRFSFARTTTAAEAASAIAKIAEIHGRLSLQNEARKTPGDARRATQIPL